MTQMDYLQMLINRATPKNLDYFADGCDTDGNLIYDIAMCPVCGKEFEYRIDDWGCKFCCWCGQALYWGDNQ